MSETAATPYYQTQVMNLFKEKGDFFFLGVCTILLTSAVFYMALAQKTTHIASTKKIDKAYIAPKPHLEQKTYVVQEGESLSEIAAAQLGDENKWTDIAKLNNITDINTITAGMKLILPTGTVVAALPLVTPAPSATIAPTAMPQEKGDIGDEGAMTKKANTKIKEYTVQEGEGLWQIAEKVYGDGEMFNEIMKENKLENPDAIFPGMKLKMPHTK